MGLRGKERDGQRSVTHSTNEGETMNHLMHGLLDSLRQQDPNVRLTLDALQERGVGATDAEDRVAQALMACVWEVTEGLPDRSSEVLQGLREGHSIDDLFAPNRYKGANLALDQH
jgi:hypothetical protein